MSWIGRRSQKPAARAHAGQGGAAQRLVLVARFDDPGGVNQAAKAFRAAGFSADEIVALAGQRQCITDIWRATQNWRSRWPVHTLTGVDDEHNVYLEEVLASGEGLLIVRSATRFHTACDIIERAGGQIGIRTCAEARARC